MQISFNLWFEIEGRTGKMPVDLEYEPTEKDMDEFVKELGYDDFEDYAKFHMDDDYEEFYEKELGTDVSRERAKREVILVYAEQEDEFSKFVADKYHDSVVWKVATKLEYAIVQFDDLTLNDVIDG